MLLLAIEAGPPEYRDFISAGTYVLGVLLTVVGGIIVARIEKARRAVEAQPTSNGWPKDITATLEQLRQSLRQVHKRLDDQNAHTARRDDHLDGVLVKFDDRLLHIEGKLDEGPSSTNVP